MVKWVMEVGMRLMLMLVVTNDTSVVVLEILSVMVGAKLCVV